MAKLIIANWKMNGDSSKINHDIEYYQNMPVTNQKNVVLALPYSYIGLAQQKLLASANIQLAAQDLSQYPNYGAYTGEINGSMLKDIGASYVLIGHSERRSLLGESDEILVNKLSNAFASNLIPVFCVGEVLAIREAGSYLTFIEKQLSQLSQLKSLGDMVIAYEPCWAIGSGKIPTLIEIGQFFIIDF